MSKFLILIAAIIYYFPSLSQPTYIGDAPYDIEKTDFNLNVAHFYSKAIETTIAIRKSIDSVYRGLSKDIYEPAGWHEGVICDTIYEQADTDTVPPISYIFYDQKSASYDDSIAHYGNFYFMKLSMITNEKGTLMAIYANQNHVSKNRLNQLLETLNKKWGTPIRDKGLFKDPYDIYRWTTPTAIIQVTPIEEISIGETEAHEKAPRKKTNAQNSIHFYVINRKFKNAVQEKALEGDFIFCK